MAALDRTSPDGKPYGIIVFAALQHKYYGLELPAQPRQCLCPPLAWKLWTGDFPYMRVTIERQAFLKALNHVQSVVERRNTIPILSNVMVQAKAGDLFDRG